jgi:endoglucanase
LKGGPVLGLGPNIHAKLFHRLRATARQVEMGHNVKASPTNSGTDAAAVQVSREGIPTALVSIPIRNMHTPAEVVALDDVERTGRLLAECIAGLDGGTLADLKLD